MPFTQSHALPVIILGSGIALATALTLSGCTETPAVEPSTSNPSSSSSAPVEPTETSSPAKTDSPEPEPTPSPEITPPAKPEAMKHNNEKGAIAFANYFLDVYEYTGQTLDTELLEEMSNSSCSYCKEVIENSRELKAQGNSTSGYGFTVQSPFSVSMTSEHAFGLHGVIEKSSYSIKDNDGNEITKVPSDLMPAGVAVSFTASGWTVIAFGREELGN